MQLPLHIQDLEKGENHIKSIKWIALEETFKAHVVQLDQVAWSLIHDAECVQEWGTHYLSGKPVPVFCHPQH